MPVTFDVPMKGTRMPLLYSGLKCKGWLPKFWCVRAKAPVLSPTLNLKKWFMKDMCE